MHNDIITATPVPNIEPAKIHILPPNGEQGTLLSIHGDGRITFGSDFTTADEASKEFWRLLAEAVPAIKSAWQKEATDAR